MTQIINIGIILKNILKYHILRSTRSFADLVQLYTKLYKIIWHLLSTGETKGILYNYFIYFYFYIL
jgi:hypothetical protein